MQAPGGPGGTESEFGRFILGVIKLVLMGVIYTILMSIGALDFPSFGPGEGGASIGDMVRLVIAFAPLLLLISALKDLGVRL